MPSSEEHRESHVLPAAVPHALALLVSYRLSLSQCILHLVAFLPPHQPFVGLGAGLLLRLLGHLYPLTETQSQALKSCYLLTELLS